MILTLTSSREIASLDGQPRQVHNAGVWFADASGVATHRLDHVLWTALGRPESIEIDFGISEAEIATVVGSGADSAVPDRRPFPGPSRATWKTASSDA